ncbi:MAG TPA: LLM class F420-dependent oxidoreductase [Deltaproteobacteria bacterium]|nr:LLM class F420-dependent oxidoreductase [Deltaproteobacteria bacterium]
MPISQPLRFGVMFGYWQAAPPDDFVGIAQEAERMGFDSAWTAEAWGSDAFTPLAWIGAHTTKLKLGTSIVQISARTPTSTAMHALTLDHLSKGRLLLGLGVSGPQVVEGWYGQPFSKPLSRTREYIDIIRQVMRRERPVRNDGPHYPLPYSGEGAWGMGKPLKPITHPLRADLPIYLGAEGPKNVALAAELCDGWIPLWYSPYREEVYADSLTHAPADFDIVQGVTVAVTDDLASAYDTLRPMLGFYIGGMGSKDRNFHKELMGRMGFPEQAQKIQDLFMAGDRGAAIAAVPDEFIDEIALVGPRERIRDRLQAWRESRVTTLLIHAPDRAKLREIAEIVMG